MVIMIFKTSRVKVKPGWRKTIASSGDINRSFLNLCNPVLRGNISETRREEERRRLENFDLHSKSE